jgi:hypothetical protein
MLRELENKGAYVYGYIGTSSGDDGEVLLDP